LNASPTQGLYHPGKKFCLHLVYVNSTLAIAGIITKEKAVFTFALAILSVAIFSSFKNSIMIFPNSSLPTFPWMLTVNPNV
jgi:hypothetical protein